MQMLQDLQNLQPTEQEMQIYSTAVLSDAFASQGITCSSRCCVTEGMLAITGFTLFIIGCVGAAGGLSGVSIGWIAIGLGGASMLFHLSAEGLGKRKFSAIAGGSVLAATIIMGGLGVAGIVSARAIGWTILVAPIIAKIVELADNCSRRDEMKEQARKAGMEAVRESRQRRAALRPKEAIA